MFSRFLAQFALVFLFVFAQMGALAHEISHFQAPTEQNQPDQYPHTDVCPQCVGIAGIDSSFAPYPFVFSPESTTFSQFYHVETHRFHVFCRAWQARAPPAFA